MQAQSLSARVYRQGALPLVDLFLQRLNLQSLFEPQIAHPHYRDALELMVKSILLCPSALYRIQAWSQTLDPRWLPPGHFGDDALGRALDRLFESDRASLLTALIVRAITNFDIQTEQIHNDSTTVKFSGAYERQKPQAVQLRLGRSKDHRPDLKQLVYCLSVSADGAVPVHFKAYAGNQADNPTHWETWQCLGRILGHADFLYVADSKLCVKETLLRIHEAHGRFITMLPRTRSEWSAFNEQLAHNRIQWLPLWNRCALRKGWRREVFEQAAHPHPTAEGFRLYWYRSSEKRHRDAQDRQERLSRALHRLNRLNERRGRGPKTEPALRRAAENTLARYRVQALVEYEIKLQNKIQFTQKTICQPTRQVIRRRMVQPVPVISARVIPEALAQAQNTDGTFPLVTNTDLSPLEVLRKYKYQPHLEKRHFLSKTVLEISPVFLKNNTRIEALMFLYFMAQLVAALIERTLRQSMVRQGLKSIPILPEGRESKTPSFAQIREAFADRTKAEFYEKDRCLKTCSEPLTELQLLVLQLLGVSAAAYN